jgi:hypothetical protein
MGEAAFALPPSPKRRKPRDEWAKDFSDAEIRRALERLDLTAREHMLLERLCILSLQEGYAFMGQEKLAALLRCSERTLRATTRRLCKRGLLRASLFREGLSYLPQWEAIGLEGPDSERERSGQRPAKSADPDRQNLPMPPYRSRMGSRRSESSSRRHPERSPASACAPSTPAVAAAAPLAFREERPTAVPVPSALQPAAVPAPASLAPLDAEPSPEPVLTLVPLSPEQAAEADRELEAFRADRSTEWGAIHAPAAPQAPPEAPEASPTTETASLARQAPEEAPTRTQDVLIPTRLGRVAAPPVVVVAPPDQLAQVLEKFGVEARDDVLEVLRSWPARRHPRAASDALDRLLEMDPGAIQTSAGACFRTYLRLACSDQLRLAKTHPRGGTRMQRLERARDDAAQRGDFETANALKERMFEEGQRAREQVVALRQLVPHPAPTATPPVSFAAPPPIRRLAAPVKALPAPTDPTEALRADAEALRARLSLRYGPTPLERAKLERELAEIETKLAACEPRTLEESPHAQQGQ